MAGTPMSSASLRGLKVRRPKRTLNTDEVRGVYSSIQRPKREGLDRDWFDDNVFRVVHFNSEGPAVIDAELLLTDQMIHIPDDGREASIIDQFIEGYQINGALPEPEKLTWFRKKQMWGKMDIILQIGDLAMKKASKDPENLAVLIESYKDTIDYVLWDPSEGHGVALDAEFARPYLRAIRKHCPYLGLAVSGKLGPKTMNLAWPLLAEFPDLSFDTESEIRDGNDNLVVTWALDFLEECAKKCEKKKSFMD